MAERFDKLGRRIPAFDRSAAGKKAAATNKEKNENYYNELGAAGGKHRSRGYFGKLKDEGRIEELRQLASKNSVGYFKILKDSGQTKKLKAISQKGAKAHNGAVRSGSKHPTTGGGK